MVCHLQPIWSGAGCKLLLWVMRQGPEAGSLTSGATTLARRLSWVQLTLPRLPFSCKCSEGFIFPHKKGQTLSTLKYKIKSPQSRIITQKQFQNWTEDVCAVMHLRRSVPSPTSCWKQGQLWDQTRLLKFHTVGSQKPPGMEIAQQPRVICSSAWFSSHLFPPPLLMCSRNQLDYCPWKKCVVSSGGGHPK